MRVGELRHPERLVEHFWAKVDRSEECWIWRGARSGGAGRFGVVYTDGVQTSMTAGRSSRLEQRGEPILADNA